MQIAYHLGAHVTDEGQIFKCLTRNAAALAQRGIAIPGPGRFRAPLAQALQAQQSGDWNPDLQAALIDTLVDDDAVERIVLSVDSMLCPAPQVLDEGILYPMAEARVERLAALFEGLDVEFLLALRNPATFLPALHQRIGRGNFRDLLAQADPMTLRWSDCVARIVAGVPRARVTVWCNEDSPLLWPRLLRAVGGHEQGLRLDGVEDFLATLMTPEGVKRMQAYIVQHPPKTDIQYGRIVSAFLDKFARPDEIEMDLGHTGWSESYVAALTEIYEEDVARLTEIPGLVYLTP